MKTAVLLTGALRTITKTIRYLKENVLVSSDTDLFICVQNDTSKPNHEWNAWFQEHVGSWMKDHVVWFSTEAYSDWIVHRERLLEHMILDPSWKGYLRNSGSMIEYAQLQMAYLKVSHYEQLHRMRYDYIVRARTDSIYTKPVDFHWLSWSLEEVEARMHRVREELRQCGQDASDRSVAIAFMVTLLSDEVIPNLANIWRGYQASPVEAELPTNAEEMVVYLRKGRYILTLRKNNLYLVRRELFYLIPSLADLYGHLRSPCSDDYWFNAEGQFRDACYYSCLDVFDYSTEFEERSLEYAPSWKGEAFFDENMNCIQPMMLYCVVRK